MSYMDKLIDDLRQNWDIDDEGLAFIRAELAKSFKNGIERGRSERTTAKRTASGSVQR